MILGLDLGSNSVGWALLTEKDELAELTAVGVRVFTEAVEPKSKVPKNAERRAARGIRKNLDRRRRRRNALRAVLTQAKMLPTDSLEFERLFFDHGLNPYLLRARALTERLTLHEIGRALYHLNQRRGYQSNRRARRIDKVDDPEIIAVLKEDERQEELRALERKQKRAEKGQRSASDDEDSVVLAGIATLKSALQASTQPLGVYLHNELAEGRKVRKRHTERSMYAEEFERIWETQRTYYPHVLTDGLKAEIYSIMFHQRPLKIQRFLVGRCRFEPNRKCAMKAHPVSQTFRILQEVANLRAHDDVTKLPIDITLEQRHTLADALEHQGSMNWSAVRKLLKLDKNTRFNFEESKRDAIEGNTFTSKMRSVLGDSWDAMDHNTQDSLAFDLLNIPRKDALVRRLRRHWNLSAEAAYKLAIWEPPTGTMSLSVKAMRKLIPFLREGMHYREACEKVGYKHDEERSACDLLNKPPDFRNPVVNKAMNQVRRVVNAIIRKYGKPDVIRIEMARDMKLNKKEKAAVQRQNNENRKANEEAETELRNIGIHSPSDIDLKKYRLWKECGGICPYTGHPITLDMLRTGEVDIEHIIPYSRSLDDSFNNLTLCYGEENRNVKRNKTPFEAYGHDPQRWREMSSRISTFKRRKRILFTRETVPEEVTEEMAAAKLNDTRYICRAVKDYVATLGTTVTVSKGEATALLRRAWGLNAVLGDGQQKARDDHRHHAVDALVIALTSVSLFQKLSRLSGIRGGSLLDSGITPPEPFPNFWNIVNDKFKQIVVSHAPTRKIAGAFHEETAYGKGMDSSGNELLVYRKPLSDLSAPETERIRDPHIKRLVMERIEEAGNAKKAFADEHNPLVLKDKAGEVVKDAHNRPRVIRSVRIAKRGSFNPAVIHGVKNESGVPYKFFTYGNNHHVEVLECLRDGAQADGKKWKKGDRRGVFVTTMEAANRARRLRLPIVQRDHGSDWKFVMSLCRNDIFKLEELPSALWRVQKLDATSNRVVLREITAANLDDPDEGKQVAISKLIGTKLAVGPLGDLHPCSD